MSSESINHKALAESRLATQYRNSVRLIAYIKALLSEADTLELVFRNLIENRWIDTASGFSLDILGSIVGQPRELIDAELFEYFGFDGFLAAETFSSVSDLGLGGRFISVGESSFGVRLLIDGEYRTFIRARILRNSTSSTPEEVIAHLKFIFNSATVVLVEGLEASYELSIGRVLSVNEKALLTQTDIVPKTAGVTVSYYSEFDTDGFFSFQGIPGSLGFGSVNNSELGGQFGQLIF